MSYKGITAEYLSVQNGGTGAGIYCAHSILMGNGINPISKAGPLGKGELLIGQENGPPINKTLKEGPGIYIDNEDGEITINSTASDINCNREQNTVEIGLSSKANDMDQITIGNDKTKTIHLNGSSIKFQYSTYYFDDSIICANALMGGIITLKKDTKIITLDNAEELYKAMGNPLYLGLTIDALIINKSERVINIKMGKNMIDCLARDEFSPRCSRLIKIMLIQIKEEISYNVYG